MDKPKQPEFIESTAGQVAAELARRGLAPDQRVMTNGRGRTFRIAL
jgi:hypothetical protein